MEMMTVRNLILTKEEKTSINNVINILDSLTTVMYDEKIDEILGLDYSDWDDIGSNLHELMMTSEIEISRKEI